jgi:hypothetical protein
VDEKQAVPSHEFGQATKEALAKATTVMLPSPPPASGRLFIGINPDFNPDLPFGSPHFFLRLVQTVSPKQVIMRIVDLNELRGVSLPAPSTDEDRALRVFRTVNDIADVIKTTTDSLTAAEVAKRGVYEVCLFEDAVIYVPEWAPVFLRIQYELGVSAVEAAENVDSLIPTSRCLCPMPTYPLFAQSGGPRG